MSGCKRCGECCRFLDIAVSYGYDEEIGEFYGARGLPIHYANQKMIIEVPHVCQHLVETDGVYGCAIYDDRPAFCREWECSKCSS